MIWTVRVGTIRFADRVEVLQFFSLKLDISYALMLWYPKILLKYYSYARALALCMRPIGTFIYRQNEFHDYYTK